MQPDFFAKKMRQMIYLTHIIFMVEHFEAFLNFSLPLKVTNFSSLKWVTNSSSRKILHELL